LLAPQGEIAYIPPPRKGLLIVKLKTIRRNKMKKRKLFMLLISLGLLLALAPFSAPASNAAPQVLKMVSFLPPNAGPVVGAHTFVDTVNKRMAGKVQINWLGGPEVIGSFDQPGAVASGTIDGAFTVVGYYSNLVPVAFLKVVRGTTLSESRKSGFYDLFNQQFQKAGLYYLGDLPTGAGFVFYLRKKISDIGDFKGLLIRTGGIQRPFVLKLGGQAQDIPLGDVYTALQRGVIDGAIGGYTKPEQDWVEQAPSIVEPAIYAKAMPGEILLNLKRWNSLAPDIQQGLIKIENELEPKMYKQQQDLVAQARQELIKRGATFIQIPEKTQYIHRSREAVFEYVGKQPGVTPQLLDQFRAVMPAISPAP
jgi:TRAP-type C4-dicarboxylate transport system substrate-binding protein